MKRYIDADALTSKIRHFFFELIDKVEPIMTEDGGAFDLKIVNPLLEANKAIASIIREQPTADVVEAVPGEWKQISPAKIYECSVCGQLLMSDDIDIYHFCHGCGAKMDGGTW